MLEHKQWFYWYLKYPEGWEHLATMPSVVPIGAIDPLMIQTLPSDTLRLMRGLFNYQTFEYETWVDVWISQKPGITVGL